MSIGFTTRPCDSAFGVLWDVPAGTVTYIVFHPKEPIPVTAFGLDEGEG